MTSTEQGSIPTTTLAGVDVPVLGQGTWHMGDRRAGDTAGRYAEELATLRRGLDLGLTLIDTAEMYGDGASERLVGEAISGRRDDAFLVSKVLPTHADHAGVVRACEASLGRLGTDHLDLYLLHWKGSHPLAETVAGFEQLIDEGKIRAWGVSNFDADDLRQLPAGAEPATDQVLYNLSQRWPEDALLPEAEHRGFPVMAYSPIEQGRLAQGEALRRVAARHGATPAQIALAWTIRSGRVIAIPQTSSPAHVEQNAAAGRITLDAEDLAALDRAFPAPRPGARMTMH